MRNTSQKDNRGATAPFHLEPTMLIVTLKEGEKILIGDKITVNVLEIRGRQIRIGVEAPNDVLILRDKLAKRGEA